MISNVEEVRARGAKVIAITSFTDDRLEKLSNHVVLCPDAQDPALQALLTVIPLQLLAYSIATLRGTDVDQPRNLAKSVTVE